VIVKDDAAMDVARRRPCCEWCGHRCPNGTHPHHLFTRGAGRIDAPWNLVSLCAFHHRSHHDGNEPLKADLLAIVAQREKMLQEDVELAVWCVRRLPRDARPEQVERELRGLKPLAAKLVRQALKME